MSKERRTVSLDQEVEEYLARESVNASSLINQLVRNHMSTGGNRKAMLELRREQIQSELSELESRKESKAGELEKVETELSEITSERETVFDEAADVLSEEDLELENRKVDYWADQAGVSVDELKQEVRDRIP